MPLSNTQYDEIMRRYDQQQILNQHIVEERVAAVYAQAPRLSELDEKISSCSVLAAEKIIDGDTSVTEELRRQIKACKEEKEEILSSLGYPRDYFLPPYRCKDCKDTGYIGSKPCHCFRQAAIDLVYTQSNLKEILKNENFDTLTLDYYPKDLINHITGKSAYETAEIAVRQCHAFADNFGSHAQNLFFYGGTGVGKTFLSNCIAKQLLDAGHSVIYFTAPQLFDIFEKDVFRKDVRSGQSRQNVYDCELLIIDDLGTEVSNSFTSSQLYLCINERILRKRSTIISTNLSIKQLADSYSERIFSRISSNYTMLQLFGDDIRIAKKLRQ